MVKPFYFFDPFVVKEHDSLINVLENSYTLRCTMD
jgi:hypothetical protein